MATPRGSIGVVHSVVRRYRAGDPIAHLRVAFSEFSRDPPPLTSEYPRAVAVGHENVSMAVLLIKGMAEGVPDAEHQS